MIEEEEHDRTFRPVLDESIRDFYEMKGEELERTY